MPFKAASFTIVETDTLRSNLSEVEVLVPDFFLPPSEWARPGESAFDIENDSQRHKGLWRESTSTRDGLGLKNSHEKRVPSHAQHSAEGRSGARMWPLHAEEQVLAVRHEGSRLCSGKQIMCADGSLHVRDREPCRMATMNPKGPMKRYNGQEQQQNTGHWHGLHGSSHAMEWRAA